MTSRGKTTLMTRKLVNGHLMNNQNRGVRIHIGKEETGVRFLNMIGIFDKIGITVANGMTEGLDTEITDGQTLMMIETTVITIMVCMYNRSPSM